MKLNDYEKARGALLSAVNLVGHPPQCYELLAFIYAEYGDQNQALIWLERLQPNISDEKMIELLMASPFSRMPNLMLKLDSR